MLEDEVWMRIPDTYLFKHRLLFCLSFYWRVWSRERKDHLPPSTQGNLFSFLPKAVGDVFAFTIFVIAIQSLIGRRAAQRA